MRFGIHRFSDLALTNNFIIAALNGETYEKFSKTSFTEEKEQSQTLSCCTSGVFSLSPYKLVQWKADSD